MMSANAPWVNVSIFSRSESIALSRPSRDQCLSELVASPLAIRPGARLGSGSQSWLSMPAGATATSETAISGIAILTGLGRGHGAGEWIPVFHHEPLPENGAKPGFSRRFAMRRSACCASVNFGFRPMRCPRSAPGCDPRAVRVRIRSRSTSVKPPNTAIINRPVLVAVSTHGSSSDRNCALASTICFCWVARKAKRVTGCSGCVF
jgi:hypothetical protein